ncbi:MAG: TonB-dependent receptor, partial [Gammaproteobacteria bacterium]|nr:TonB-dependent receptor [Gammaproteobacteria bacterium]
MIHRKHPKSLLAAAILAAQGFSPAVLAQDDETNLSVVEEIITTGTRGRPRTVADSPVPVDVFSAADIEAISHTDTQNILQTLVPSYNVSRQPISDGATFIRPAQLRGLPTDKTLVLINNKRRHRSALVSIGGSGTQGPDVATIPAAAIKNIEVLRDGASAQYGSDAIAGVINFLLNDNSEGGSLTIDSGEFFEGDGAMTTIQGNIGLPLGEDGFVSISGEYVEADRTVRAQQYCHSWFCVDSSLSGYQNSFTSSDPGAYGMTRGELRREDAESASYRANFRNANAAGVSEVVQPWGQPQIEAARVFVNAGYQLDQDTEAYAYGNFSDSDTDGNFFYRYPHNGTIEDLRRPDGSIYTPLEIFPGGFTPQFAGNVLDFSIIGGLRGELDNGLTYDFSGRTGENEVRYTLFNTINPSLGPNTPTSFRPSDLINTETQFQADFTYEFDAGIAGPALFAFGASFMDESYELAPGDPASYVPGPYATQDPWSLCEVYDTDGMPILDRSFTRPEIAASGVPTINGQNAINAGSNLNCADPYDPVYQVVGVGSNGFPGNSPQFTDIFERNSFAVYGELSGDITDALYMQGAVRYENYDDFDSEVLFQLAGRLVLTDNWNARASIGTGFRAPTPGQQGTVNVSTRLPDGFPVASGLFPAGGPVAAALGADPLRPEKSNSFTIGVTGSIGDLDLTFDYYRIDIDDRTWAISPRRVSTSPGAGEAYQNFLALDAAGVAGANSIGQVQYFTNAFDSSTEGLDIVA